jgi:hypothetical protein
LVAFIGSTSTDSAWTMWATARALRAVVVFYVANLSSLRSL